MRLDHRDSATRVLRTLMLAAAATAPAAAQVPIQWSSDVEASFKQARQQNRPLFIVVPGERSASRSRDSFEDAQKESFRDPRVVALVDQRFVPLKLQRSNENQDLFVRLGLPANAQLRGVIVTADGTVLEKVNGRELAGSDRCLANLKKGWDAYVEHLFTTEVEPVLERGADDARKLATALELARNCRMQQADGAVANLLSSEVKPAQKKLVYATLAALSTEKSVRALLERCGKDREAAAALRKCSPGVVEAIAAALNDKYDATHIAAYDAVCAILMDKAAKREAFWEQAEAAKREAEVARVRVRAADAAAAWRQQNPE